MNVPPAPPAPAQPAGNRNTIVAIVVAVVLLCCCCLSLLFGWYAWNNGDAWLEGLSLLPVLLSV